MKLSVNSKVRIINLSLKGFKPSKVVQIMEKFYCVKTTRLTVYNTMKRYKEKKQISNSNRCGRNTKVTVEHMNFIDDSYYDNDELSAASLKDLLMKKFNLDLSISAIKKLRAKLGWVQSGPKYCQAIRGPNCVKRLEFAQNCISSGDTFDDVIFTDESTIEIARHSIRCFRKIGQPHKLKPLVKHPFKLHVWGGISRRGRTRLIIFSGIMRKEFFVGEILKKGVVPFVKQVYPDGHRFQQDNDPKHTSNLAKYFLIDNGIIHWKTPAESPDLNPIEMV